MATRDELQARLDSLKAFDAPVEAEIAALEAEIAALDATTDPPVVEQPPVDPPPVTQKSIVTVDDIEYLGMALLPLDDYDWQTGQLLDAAGNPQLRFAYSNGHIAGRRVNGELRFAITQSNADKWFQPVCEIALPATLSKDIATAERCTVVNRWGDIYQDKRLLQTPYRVMTGGLAWVTGVDGLDYLLWTYYDSYNVAAKWNPSIGATRFNADGTFTAFGPWRTTVDSHKSCGFLIAIPPAMQALFGGRSLAVGAPQTAGDALSPWGGSLLALPDFDVSLTPDPIGLDNATLPKSIDVIIGMLQDVKHPLFLNKQYQNCAWVSMTKSPAVYDSSQGGILTPPAIEDEGGRLQTFGSACWIDTPTKCGLVFMGEGVMPHPDNAADPDKWPHAWYGPSPCPHGRVDSVSNSKGNHTDQLMPIWAVYDPADVAAIVAGTKQPYEVQPVSMTNVMSKYGAQNLPGQSGVPTGFSSYHGSGWRDPSDGKIYQPCCNEERVGSSPRPVLRVFQGPV